MSRWFPTSGRGRALLFVGLAILVGGLVWWRMTGNHGEPSYGGRPLSYWLEEGREAITNGSKSMPIQLNAESEAAVQAIGTNAMPTLIGWMVVPKKGWRTKFYNWIVQRRPPDVVGRAAYLLSGFHRWKPGNSCLAFQVLGRDAEGAIPFLIEMLHREENMQMVVVALSVIRPEGVNALIETFPRIADEEQRMGIMEHLENAVTPDLEPTFANFAAKWATEDPSPHVRATVAYRLATFSNSAAVAVPALTRALKDRDVWVRSEACKSLGHFGKEAASATASLRVALSDSHPQVRADAARALQAIGVPPDK